MPLARLTLAALAATLLAVPTTAAPCQTPVCNTPVVQTPVIVAPVAVTLPLYGAAYTGESDAETRELLKALLNEIKALRADLQSRPPAGDPGDGPPVPPLKAVDVGALVKSRCAACHTSKVAEEKGGGLELVTDDAKLIRLGPPTRREVIKRTGNGTMPPPGKAGAPLTPAEREALKRALTDAPAIPAAKN